MKKEKKNGWMEPWRGESKSVKRARLEISGSINLWNETERVQRRCARTHARGSIQMCCYSGDVSLVINHSDKSSVGAEQLCAAYLHHCSG